MELIIIKKGLVNNKEVDKIVVLYKDRLLRFGFELVEYMCLVIDYKENEQIELEK